MYKTLAQSTLAITLTVLLLSTLTSNTHAAITTTFSGRVIEVLVNGGTYAGTTVDDVFSGSFTYGDTADQGSTSGPQGNGDEQDWDFNVPPFTASISDGLITTTLPKVNVSVGNNVLFDSDDVALANKFPGFVGVTITDPIDIWVLSALTNGAFFDNVTDDLKNGILVDLVFLKVGTQGSPPTLFTDLAYPPLAPAESSVDLIGFIIEEADSNGNTLFRALGVVESFTSVPEPASLSLLALGSTLILARRRRVDVL